MRHSSDVVFRFSLGKREGRMEVRIASAACWKTPHLSLLYEKGYVSSAKGAAFIASPGASPQDSWFQDTSAESANHFRRQ
jgi:hypothetical protein